MTGWAIVAIPEEQDPVWKYSSEKIPHMTLLFLGDQTGVVDADRMAAYVQHVAETSLRPFYMQVSHRGTLGPDDADVLFFDIRKGQSSPLPGQARGYLLADDDIQKAFGSVEQFPEWTPHLTMGYPTSPAKKDDRDYPTYYSVRFDKIALWTGDFTGPEFQLEYPISENETSPMAMSDEVLDFLEHRAFPKAKREALAKSGKAMPNESYPIENAKDLKNAIRAVGLGGASKDAIRKHIITRAKKMKMTNMIPDTWNSDGTLKHDALAEDFIEHYGVKGMHWGVRREHKTTVIRSKGGKIRGTQLSDKMHTDRSAPSEDANRAAVAKAVVRSHSTDALSNQELQALVTRMNLEQQYANLSSKGSTISRGRNAVNETMKTVNTANQVYSAVNSPMVKDLRKMMNG